MRKPYQVTSRVVALLLALCGPVLLMGCESHRVAEPTVAGLVGAYRATQLDFVRAGETENALAQGAEMTVELAADGTTRGRFFLPAGVGGSAEDVELDMSGTWLLDRWRVYLELTDLSLLDGLPFDIIGPNLFADAANADGRTVRVYLTRQ